MSRALGAVSAFAAAGIVVLAGCVGPATTQAAYRGKAVHAADAALSEVQTAALTARGLLQGRVLQAFTETVVSGAEDAMTSIQGSFDSIQPPDNATSDALRNGLDGLLSTGSSDVSDLRIAVRRQDDAAMAALAARLEKDASKLRAFSQEHGG